MTIQGNGYPIQLIVLVILNLPVVVGYVVINARAAGANSLGGRRAATLRLVSPWTLFGGAVVVFSWGELVGLSIFPSAITLTLDASRVLVWSVLLLATATAYGTWIWRSLPAYPRLGAISAIVVFVWFLASAVFQPS